MFGEVLSSEGVSELVQLMVLLSRAYHLSCISDFKETRPAIENYSPVSVLV